MTPDIQELKDLTTIIAELEEAERAVRPGAFSVHETELVYGSRCTIRRPDGSVICDTVIDRKDARLIALMRTHLPTLIEAVKRQGEALEKIADPATYSHNLPSCCQHTFDDACELFSDIARAALKETTDV